MSECSVEAIGTSADPAELQRRLGKVYRLLIDLARRQRSEARSESEAETQTTQ